MRLPRHLRLNAFAIVALLAFARGAVQAQALKLPVVKDSVKFAVIGDTGTGSSSQQQVAALLTKYRTVYPFDFVIMLGDNLYGGESPRDFRRKFEEPYKALLDAGVRFYAALGNHDLPNQRYYKLFNMDEKRYYSFSKGNVKFVVIDSTYVDPEQLKWIENELKNARDPWEICYFHHPIYSSGAKHGSDLDLRARLEPLFIENGVDVVFAGHEHFYERLKPQNGITYFVQGASAKLRKGNIRKSAMTAVGFDDDNSFTLVEISNDEMYFQTIARSGKTVDAGSFLRREKAISTNGR
ncbi:MAG: metallophosphoesterase [Acidobacteria bacterium]|nr:metallophosphoesterase [Acidobacteriota bacterium]